MRKRESAPKSWGRSRGREREKTRPPLGRVPDVGLQSQDLRSSPEQRQMLNPLSHPSAPNFARLDSFYAGVDTPKKQRENVHRKEARLIRYRICYMVPTNESFKEKETSNSVSTEVF